MALGACPADDKNFQGAKRLIILQLIVYKFQTNGEKLLGILFQQTLFVKWLVLRIRLYMEMLQG